LSPCIPAEVLAANRALISSDALPIRTDVVDALAADHIMVITSAHQRCSRRT
jgi:hypothetical protein